MTTECPLCIESVPPSRRTTCPYCDYTTCRACFTQYLENRADDAACMNPACQHLLHREDLLKMTNATWVGTRYKRLREAVLYDREVSMLPATQPHVTRELQRRENARLVQSLQEERHELRRKLRRIEQAIVDASRQVMPPLEERRAFVHRCARDGCRGFLNTAWRCGVCAEYTCHDCGVCRGPDATAPHVCTEDNKATMTLLRTECRRCPGCAQHIQRVSGCDQMWCVSCHTAFSWRTGHKINGTIHNPHWYEYQQQRGGGRVLGDVPCGGRPHVTELLQVIPRTHPRATHLTRLHNLITHIEHVEVPRFPTTIHMNGNLDLRIQYTLHEVSNAQFRAKLQQREKAREKRRDVGYVLQMLVDASSDILRQLVLDRLIDRHCDEIEALIDYANRQFAKIAKRYEGVAPYVDLQRYRVVSTGPHALVRAESAS